MQIWRFLKPTLLLLALPGSAAAAEGMWTLDNLPVARMHAEYGFTPDAAWVDHVMRSSVRIAGGCSASFISKDGLVMTNHHCAAQCIDQLSTAKRNYMRAGFLAKNREEEVRCPAIELNRLERISDVTDEVKKATAGLEGEAFKLAQNAVKAKLASDCVGADKNTVRCDVVDLYRGGRYHLYKYHRFQDARLVWAPEKAMAFFGGDPDNFNFPRYDLDITLLRAYENGKPAAVKDYFVFSKDGAKEGELVFTSGHPGTTQRQLTMAQLETLRDVNLYGRLLQLAELRGVLAQYMKSSPEAARIAEAHFFGVENRYKVFNGEIQALRDPDLLKRKQEEETALRRYVASKPELQAKVGGAWDAIERAQQTYRKLASQLSLLERSGNPASTRIDHAGGFASDYFKHARTLVRGVEERVKPDAERLPEFAEANLPEVEQHLLATAPIYPQFEQVKLEFALTKLRERLGVDHPFVKRVLGKRSPGQLAASLIAGTRLGDPKVRKALWQGGKEAIAKSNDPFIKLALAIDGDARAIRKRYEQEVDSVVQKNSELIAMARFEQQGTDTYPDATLTLRLSYGEVKGWDEDDHRVAPFTTIGGAFDRDTGADPFALPPTWHGAKTRLNLAQKYNLSTTNDIIGGNSGSPLINRKGEIVGLVFDGNIHSLAGAFWFDPRYNRTVSIDSGAILETLKKIYRADHLVREIGGN
ncbi:MAG TPA: S46 family peptidase [Paucimonas sp.]|nr:S46 family peptidase [Paucimonas sp.]